jgi:hypothetical protein
MVVITILILLCMGAAVFSGCSHKPGLLERQGIKSGDDLAFVIIGAGNNYLISDSPTLEHLYVAINKTVTAPTTGYYRPNYVLLVTKSNHTVIYAFDITSVNTQLRLGEASPGFTKYVKNNIINNQRKYLNKRQIPNPKSARIEIIAGSTRTTPSSSTVNKIKNSMQLLARTYIPYVSTTQRVTWKKLSSFLTSDHPGFLMILTKPIRFETLIGHVSSPEPEGAYDELKLSTLTVDKVLMYKDSDGRTGLAFHSTKDGFDWFYTTALDKGRIQTKDLDDLYKGCL